MKKSIIVFLHVGYWFLYLFVISGLLLVVDHTKIDILSPAFVALLVPAIMGFYVFYGLLFDNYLAKKRHTKVALYSLLVSILVATFTETAFYFIYDLRIFKGVAPIFIALLLITLVCLLNGIMGLVVKGFITWYDEIQIKSELNKKNYEMELALMKAQINPHFLFNTVNNIDVLIQKNSIQASEYLNKLSDMLRFMLYETKSDKIALEKELSYIDKYVDLQKIRTSNPHYVKYEVQGALDGLLIEPMLFLPFIENAFKHAENKRVENAIQICFHIEKDKIRFECENTYAHTHQIKPKHSGLGNELIFRRLALLYPNRHTLKVEDKNGFYKVNLLLLL